MYKASTNKKVYCEADYAEAEASELQFNTWKIRGILNIQEKTLPNSKLVISFDAATILKKLNGLNKHKKITWTRFNQCQNTEKVS